MENEADNPINKGSRSLTYMPWHEHIKDFFLSQWKTILIYWIGLFGIFWGIIEALSFFIQKISFSNMYVLFGSLLICFVGSFFRCIHVYLNTVPEGLIGEASRVHKIAFSKKHFWEYALAYELTKSRIEKIDQDLDDVVNNRVYVKVTKTMDVEQYMQWMQTRPENFLRIVDVAKQLLIFDLINAAHADTDDNVDYHNLIRVIELTKDAYRSTYDFEIEGREINIPEGFELVHEIQCEWVSVIRDAFHQMLEILKSTGNRAKSDFSPLEKTIVFESPPRIDEFTKELDRISALMRLGHGD